MTADETKQPLKVKRRFVGWLNVTDWNNRGCLWSVIVKSEPGFETKDEHQMIGFEIWAEKDDENGLR